MTRSNVVVIHNYELKGINFTIRTFVDTHRYFWRISHKVTIQQFSISEQSKSNIIHSLSTIITSYAFESIKIIIN